MRLALSASETQGQGTSNLEGQILPPALCTLSIYETSNKLGLVRLSSRNRKAIQLR